MLSVKVVFRRIVEVVCFIRNGSHWRNYFLLSDPASNPPILTTNRVCRQDRRLSQKHSVVAVLVVKTSQTARSPSNPTGLSENSTLDQLSHSKSNDIDTSYFRTASAWGFEDCRIFPELRCDIPISVSIKGKRICCRASHKSDFQHMACADATV